MSLSQHLQTLERYGASAIRVVPVNGEDEMELGEGGQLEPQFAALGRGPLLEVLQDPKVHQVTLADGDLEVEATRDGAKARLDVRREGSVVTTLRFEIGPVVSTTGGLAMFRPDHGSRIEDFRSVLSSQPSVPVFLVEDESGGTTAYSGGWHGRGAGARPLVGSIGQRDPATLGASSFMTAHGTKWAYVAGAMAGGIASADLVIAMAKADLLGFFGAGGLPLPAVEEGLQKMSSALPDRTNWGANLLHNPHEPEVEEKTVDLYLKYGVRRVSASAYMGLSKAVVRYRLTGLVADDQGNPAPQNHVFAKVSRPEVAEKFLLPAPQSMLDELVSEGAISAEQAQLAANLPIACDITAEADSGGHTDHRPLVVLLPILQNLRDRIQSENPHLGELRVGAAGGLGTPRSLWSAFAMGADFVLTGSVNQASIEAGTSPIAKEMLGTAAYTDVASGPAPDMFEIGAKVQVLSRGSMYAQRSQQLYEIYKTYPSMDDIPEKVRSKIERQMFKRPLSEIWDGTREYWTNRDPEQVARAEREPRHKMALTFRWYLGMTSRWARIGEEDRKRDYQVWCGPSMGGFNDWVRGRDLEPVAARSVVAIAEALMDGAAGEARVAQARLLGLA